MHSVGIICLERCVKRCEVMVNLSLVYLFAATLFENNNVFYICIYISFFHVLAGKIDIEHVRTAR